MWLGFRWLRFLGTRAQTANDPKLSDRGVRRGTCMAGGKVAAEAGAVTHGAVRCSAWLGACGALVVTLLNLTGGTMRGAMISAGSLFAFLAVLWLERRISGESPDDNG